MYFWPDSLHESYGAIYGYQPSNRDDCNRPNYTFSLAENEWPELAAALSIFGNACVLS